MEVLKSPVAARPELGVVAEEGGAAPSIQLTVEKRVPLVGWLLLGLALVGSQSSGAVVSSRVAG